MEGNCDKNCVVFVPTGKTEYSFCVKSSLEKIKTVPFYVCVIRNRSLYFSNTEMLRLKCEI